MDAPFDVLNELSEPETPPAEVVELVSTGEELLFRVKMVARRIDEQCRQAVEDDSSPQAPVNRLAGLY
jgi:hypothetical protein